MKHILTSRKAARFYEAEDHQACQSSVTKQSHLLHSPIRKGTTRTVLDPETHKGQNVRATIGTGTQQPEGSTLAHLGLFASLNLRVYGDAFSVTPDLN